MTENDLLAAVLDIAKLYGWRRAHFRPGLTVRGWRTPVQGDGAGFPDLLLLKGGQMLAVELKSDKGHLTLDQEHWLNDFEAIPDCETAVWRPKDWRDATILMRLRA